MQAVVEGQTDLDGALGVDVDAAFWLTCGDPGDWPGVPAEPSCELLCCDLDVLAASGSAAASAAASVFASDAPAPSAGTLAGWAVPGVDLPPAGPSPLLAQLGRALDAVAAGGPLSGSAVDTAGLLALAERARGLALRELAELDAVGGHQSPTGSTTGDGTRPAGLAGPPGTAATWLRDTRNLSDATARSTVRLARALRTDVPQVAAQLVAGTITAEHAAAVVAGVHGLDRDIVTLAQDGLCALVASTDPTTVRATLRDKAIAVDDRLAADAARRTRARIGLRLAQVGDHTAIDGTLTAEDGATVRLAMDLAVQADRTDGDPRSRAARQADVLLGWATDALTRAHGPGDSLAGDAHTIRTHLHVLCTPTQLDQLAQLPDQPGQPGQPGFAELLDRELTSRQHGHPTPPDSPQLPGDRTALSRAALRRLACDATLTLTVLRDTPTGPGNVDPLYVGRSARTVSGLQFKALVVRDRTCVVRGCHRPPSRCAAHHARHWADGGDTDLNNLVLLCHQHHHDHHDHGLTLTHRDGRTLTQHGWRPAPP